MGERDGMAGNVPFMMNYFIYFIAGLCSGIIQID